VKGLITLDVRDANHAAGRFLAEGGYFMPLRESADSGAAPGAGCTKMAARRWRRRNTRVAPRWVRAILSISSTCGFSSLSHYPMYPLVNTTLLSMI
jgi:hypothetical protein